MSAFEFGLGHGLVPGKDDTVTCDATWAGGAAVCMYVHGAINLQSK